jgi:hypothetical protein
MISIIQGKEYAHEAIHEKCVGCERVHPEEKVCVAYLYPAEKWRLGNCPMATHVTEQADDSKKGKVRVGQQKQKKGK